MSYDTRNVCFTFVWLDDLNGFKEIRLVWNYFDISNLIFYFNILVLNFKLLKIKKMKA
jgi:hypothetical protein